MTMTYASVAAAFASLREFTPALRERHSIVRLPNGHACRVLGVPRSSDDATITHVRGRLYRAAWTEWGRRVMEILATPSALAKGGSIDS